jgi:hypothetical protein
VFFFSILGLGVVGCLGLCVFVAFFSWTGRCYQLLLTRVVLKGLRAFSSWFGFLLAEFGEQKRNG